jgi:glycosyltransferase involved in cell wall biosynthesis
VTASLRRAPEAPRPARSAIRVLHLAFEDPETPGSGGGAVRTREIASRLHGFDLDMVLCAYPGARERRVDGQRWRHVGLRSGSKLMRAAGYSLSVPSLLLRGRYDLVVEDFAPPFTFLFAPLFTNAPVIAVVQWLFAREMERKYGIPIGWLEGVGLPLYRNFVAMSEAVRHDIRRQVPEANVCVAGCGIEEPMLAAEPRDEGYAMFLGRLDVHQKGLDTLLRAVAGVGNPDFRLKVVGDGADAGFLRRMAADLGVEQRVEFAGRLTGASKVQALAGCRFLCMPSRYETFGMVAAEAMACGKPVVGSDLLCLRELVKRDTGVLVPPGDEVALAGAMRRLWDDPGRCRRMGAGGRLAVRSLSWDTVAERQASFYHRVLRDHVRRPLRARATAAVSRTFH